MPALRVPRCHFERQLAAVWDFRERLRALGILFMISLWIVFVAAKEGALLDVTRSGVDGRVKYTEKTLGRDSHDFQGVEVL